MFKMCKGSCHQCAAAAAAEGISPPEIFPRSVLERAVSPSPPSPPLPPSPPSPPSPAQRRSRRAAKERGVGAASGGAARGGAARAAIGKVGARRRRRRALEDQEEAEVESVEAEAADADPMAGGERASEASGRQFARRAAETEAQREPESESEQLRQRVVLVWQVMLLLAAAYCVHRTCSKRCGGGKSAPNESGAKRVAL